MRFGKPPLNLSEQVARLEQRGLQGGPARIEKRLRAVGYYRLSGYLYPYRDLPGDELEPGTDIVEVWSDYVFDRRLRLCVMDAIERIEIAVRARLSLHHAPFGPFAYAEQENSLPNLKLDDRRRFLREAKRACRGSKETFAVCFREKHGDEHDVLPVWMACEVMSFGGVLTFFRGCDFDTRRLVIDGFGVHHTVFLTWLRSLNTIRNACAHHARLWNAAVRDKPKLPRDDPQWRTPVQIPNNRIFGPLTLCRVLLRHIAPQSDWPRRITRLIDERPTEKQRIMGVPANWQDSPLWSDAGQSEIWKRARIPGIVRRPTAKLRCGKIRSPHECGSRNSEVKIPHSTLAPAVAHSLHAARIPRRSPAARPAS